MEKSAIRTVLITGANSGIGKEVARQFALRSGVEKIYLACRNELKARKAKQELEEKTHRKIFTIILMDLSDPESVRAGLRKLDGPIDALVMNAGGFGGRTPMALTKDGVTHIFASNVLGHVALLEGLIQAGQLTNSAVLLGSEAARGISKMKIKRPALPYSSVEDFAKVITGKDFEGKKFDLMAAYGEVKYVGAMWMADTARRNPNLRLLTISPGSTQDTEVANVMPAPVRFFMNRIFMPLIGPMVGLAHSLEKGSQRIVDGLTDNNLRSGHFYGSKENTLVGPIVDQASIFGDLSSEAFQEHANQAIHKFV
jgi:NAD(P)-dependent dehydrogenase (short-subunit alcohol dehydrogenase family)